MNGNTSRELKIEIPNSEAANDEFNNIEAIESVYTDASIDIVNVVNAEFTDSESFSSEVSLANTDSGVAKEELCPAEIYSLNSARRTKLEKSIERRASKSRLTDRRQSARVDANGEPQKDRRVENRLTNIASLRKP